MEANQYPGSWRVCAMRVLKSMQTQVLRDRDTLWSLRNHAPDGSGRAHGGAHPEGPDKGAAELDDQFADALKTASDHIQALQHAIDAMARELGSRRMEG